MSERLDDPLRAALDAHARFVAGEFEGTATQFLAAHAALRPFLEPLLASDDGDDDDPDGEAPATASRLGDFELLRELGRGGMGVVWEALQTSLDRRVALKLIAPHFLDSAKARARFRREAVLAAGLDHPHIARVLAFGEEDGTWHLAMQLVDGRPLDALLAEHGGVAGAFGTTGDPRATHAAAAALVADLADALEHAHARGVLHRDVKPGNVLLDAAHRPVLTDFGLAREIAGGGLTLTGEFTGTLHYAAPEQLAPPGHGGLDQRIDVYALGVMLYELLAGRRPFEADSYTELRREIEDSAPPDLRRLAPTVDRDLAAIVACAIERKPNDRYPRAADLRDDLRRWLQNEPVEARPVGPLGRVRRWVERNPRVTVSALAIATAAVVALVSLWNAMQSREAELETARRFDLVQTGRLIEDVQIRERLAHPATPAFAGELAELVESLEQLGPLRERLAGLSSELRTKGLGSAAGVLARPGQHPLWTRIDELRAVVERMNRDLTDPGLPDDQKPLHRERLEHLQAELARLDVAVQDLETARFADAEARFVHDELERQRLQLEELLDDALPDLRNRLAWARSVEELTVTRQHDRWDAARERIRTEPRYGFHLQPMPGLIPLGPDPECGLERFAHACSFTDPESGPLADLSPADPDIGIVLILVPGQVIELDGQVEPIAPFLLARHELTRAQWDRLAGARRGLRYYDQGIPDLRNLGEPTKPANGVPWHVSVAVLRRAGLRLPNYIEWRWASTGGVKVPRYAEDWEGYENLRDQAYARARKLRAELAVPWNDGIAGLAPVGSFPANPFGLHDLLGNVQEWCADADDHHDLEPMRDTPWNILQSAPVLRKLAGSAWNLTPEFPVRFDEVDRILQTASTRAIGVRAALTPEIVDG